MAGPPGCICTPGNRCAFHALGSGRMVQGAEGISSSPAVLRRAGDTEDKPMAPRTEYGFSGWSGASVPRVDRIAGRTKTEVVARVNALKADLFNYMEYLDLKRREGDWHGVQDAASDIRDVSASIAALEWTLKLTEPSTS